MNYAIARVSDPDQRKALPAQKQKLFDYAQRNGWVENKDFIYIEFDETAFKENRVNFQELVIEPLQKEKNLAIAVFDKIDRFSRDSTSEERAALTKLFKKGRIELHFPSDNLFINKESPAADLFRLDIGIALAGYYSSSIRDNVARRFSQMLKDGIWVGRAPLGYLNKQVHEEGGKIKKYIELDPERDYLVRKGFEMRSMGLPYKTIAKEMKKAGLISRKKGSMVSVAQWEVMFKNPFYMGRMRYMGKEYPHNYPPIVEPWLWEKVQEANNLRAVGKTKYNSKPFLFKKLKCHICGYTISFDGPKGKGQNIYARCTEYGGRHDAKWVNEAVIYKQVREILKSIQLPKDILPDLIKEIEKNHNSEQKFYISHKKRLQAEYDKLDIDIEELFKDRKQFKSRHDVFDRMVNKIELRQKDILEELEDHSDGDKAFVIGASYLLDVCSRASELFDSKNSKLEQKRYLLDFVLSNMTLEGEKLHFTLKEPFDVIIKMHESKNWRPGQDSNL